MEPNSIRTRVDPDGFKVIHINKEIGKLFDNHSALDELDIDRFR